MEPYRVEWKRSARKDLDRLPKQIVVRVFAAVDALMQNPFPADARKLAGSEDTYRIRVGDYRVIYSIHEQVLLIEVIRVGHRRDVYR